MRSLLHYYNLLFLVGTVLLVACSSDGTVESLKKFSGEIVQKPIDQKYFGGKDYDQAFLLTIKSTGDRIFWFEKYASGNKDNGLSDYSGYYANELVVKISDNKKRQYLDKILDSTFIKSGFKAVVTDSIISQNVYELTFESKEILKLSELQKSLSGIKDIVYAIPNYIALFDQTTNQSMIEYNPNQWPYKNMGVAFNHGSSFDADMDGVEAISKYVYWRSEKKPVLIAVMDSGLDIAHPALKPALFVNTNEVPNNKDDDGNGYIDDINGWNFGANNNQLTDHLKHGTHVAGIIGAMPVPHDKMRGICPGAKLMGIKIDLDGTGFSKLFDDAKALGYCQTMGVEIVNMSFGSTIDSPPFRKAISDAIDSGMILVASAGNDGKDLNVFKKYPACYPRVITVASTNNQDKLAHDSNFETYNPYNSMIKIASPGVDIYSTIPGGGYTYFSGTSMAAPLVAGSFGVLKSLYPNASTAELLRRFYESAEILPSLQNKVSNRSRINLYRAMFQPAEQKDENDIPYKDQVIGGIARGDRIPYANWDDPGVTGNDYEHAFKICSMKQLLSIRDEDLNKHFIIMNDLDYAMRPVGTPSTLNKIFKGHIHGQGFTIQNFVLQTGYSTGLFRDLGNGATIINMKFAGAKIDGTDRVGVIAGNANGVLLNDVQIEGQVKGNRSVGLFFGSASFVQLINCYAEGVIKSDDENTYCGGFIGKLSFNNIIQKCHSSVLINGGIAGGVAGLGANSTIEDTYAHVIITGKKYLGGLIGLCSNLQIINCYTDGTITGDQICGGLIGDVQNSRISQCYSFCRVVRHKWTGGLIGKGKDFSVTASYFWSQDSEDGAGGEPRQDYELVRKENFIGWWNAGTSWALVNGFRPSIPLLPRSGPSLY